MRFDTSEAASVLATVVLSHAAGATHTVWSSLSSSGSLLDRNTDFRVSKLQHELKLLMCASSSPKIDTDSDMSANRRETATISFLVFT